MRSKLLLAACALVAVILLVINFLIPKEYEVKVVTPPAIIASLPHWVAEEKGIYAKLRLRVDTLNITGSDLMVQALMAKDADILPAVSLVDVVNASFKSPIKPYIFSHSRMRDEPPFEALTVLNGSPMTTLRDLGGKRIAVYPGATSQAAVELFLRKNGVATGDIHFLPLPPPEHLRALQRGDVDASHIYDPLRTVNLLGRSTRMVSGSVYAFLTPESAIGVSVISSRFYQEHKDAAEAYLQAWDLAIDFIRDHATEARQILRRRLNLSEEVASKATWVDATKTTEVNPVKTKETVDVLKQTKLIPADVEIDESFFLPKRK